MSSQAFYRYFRVSDKVLRIEFSNYNVITHLEDFFRGCAIFLSDSQTFEATIEIVLSDSQQRVPQALENFKLAPDSVCYTNKSDFFIVTETTLVRFLSAQPARAKVWFSLDLLNQENGHIRRALSIATQLLLRRCNRFDLHAATLINRETGRSVLFVGATGSGKSTITVLLSSQGWHYLSDDSIFLVNDNDKVKALPLRRGFALRVDSLGMLPLSENQINSGIFLSGIESKKRFGTQDLFVNQFEESCFPNVIFFPTITDNEKSFLKNISQAEATNELLKNCPWACFDRPVASQYISILAKLAKQCRSYQLFSGKDLFNARFANDLFESYANQD